MFLSNIPVLSTSGDTWLASHMLKYSQNMSLMKLSSLRTCSKTTDCSLPAVLL